MTKLEEIAWAISGQEGGELDPRWMRKARAALKAMREPSQGQMQAGMNSGQAPLCDGEIRNLWEAMIDALLDEEPT